MSAARLLPVLAAALLAALLLASARPGETQPVPGLAGGGGERHVLLGGLEGLRGVPATATLVVAAPTQAYTDGEAAAARAFLEGGGRLLVVDPTPPAASLLRALDVGIEATQARVFDPDVDGEGRWVAYATGAAGVSGQARLHASRVLLGDAQPVAVTGPFAWRDDDADGAPGLGEPRGSWMVAARQDVGAGEVLVLGSGELLTAAPFADALAAWMPGGPPLVLDEGHRMPAEPLGARALLAGHRDGAVVAAAAVLGAAAVLAAFRVRAVRTARRRRRGPVDRQTLELLAELPA